MFNHCSEEGFYIIESSSAVSQPKDHGHLFLVLFLVFRHLSEFFEYFNIMSHKIYTSAVLSRETSFWCIFHSVSFHLYFWKLLCDDPFILLVICGQFLVLIYSLCCFQLNTNKLKTIHGSLYLTIEKLCNNLSFWMNFKIIQEDVLCSAVEQYYIKRI